MLSTASFGGSFKSASFKKQMPMSMPQRRWSCTRVILIVATLHSRFLRQVGFFGSQLEPGVCFGGLLFYLGTLFASTTKMTNLSGLLYMMTTLPLYVANALVVASFFQARGSRFDLEVASGLYRPSLHLLQQQVHYTAALFLPSSLFWGGCYFLAVHPSGRWTNFLYINGFLLLGLQPNIASFVRIHSKPRLLHTVA